jgi:hypothetical protein
VIGAILSDKKTWLVQSILKKEVIDAPIWQRRWFVQSYLTKKKGDLCYSTWQRRWLMQSYLTKKVIGVILPDKDGDGSNPTWQRRWLRQSYLTKKVIGAILPDTEGDWCNPTWHRRWLVQSLLAMEWVYTVQTACRYKNKLSFLKWKLTVTSKDLEVYTETNKMRVNTR